MLPFLTMYIIQFNNFLTHPHNVTATAFYFLIFSCLSNRCIVSMLWDFYPTLGISGYLKCALNITTQQRLICMGGLTINHFHWAGSDLSG